MATRTWTYGLTANIVVLGVVSLLTDVSSEMILPILPFFLISVLSANAFIVGLVEGLADSAVAFMKVVSGRWSDVAGSRRGFVAAGYGLSTAMKVLFPLAQAWPQFLGMRIVERTGKGVRDAPRDALLTESTPAETRGKAFGFHRAMDTTGAIAGPIITLVLLATIAASPVPNYRLILLLAAIPAVITLFIVLLVRDPVRQRSPKQPLRVTFRGIPKPLWTFIGIASLFSFADFSYAFLLLRAGTHGTTVAILLYVVYNIVYAAHAFPAGILSDRVGRKPVVLTGYIAFIAMATLLVFSDLLAILVLAFVLYGLSYGMAEGTQRALVADFAPPDIKATVLGAYHTCVGAVKLASGVVAGLLWIAFAPTPTFPVGAATFAFGAMAATIAAGRLSLWKAPAKSPSFGPRAAPPPPL